MSEEEKKALEDKKKADDEAAKKAAEAGEGQGDDDDPNKSKEDKPKGDGQPVGEKKDNDAIVDELLADGTPASKEIKVKFDKFKDLTDKAKLYEQFAPTIQKIQEKAKDDPKFLDTILETAEKGDLVTQLKNLEERLNNQERSETRTVITDAVNLWGDKFTKKWNDIKPLVATLQKQGISYAESVQRATFAILPDLIKENKRLVNKQDAQRHENEQGKMGGGGGASHSVHNEGDGDGYVMSDSDKTFASRANIDPNLYKKHGNFLKEKGFDLL